MTRLEQDQNLPVRYSWELWILEWERRLPACFAWRHPACFEWEPRHPLCFEGGLFVLIFLLLLLLPIFATPQLSLAVETDYLPLCKDILSRRVSQRLLQDGITSAHGVIRCARSSIRVNADGAVSIFGSDRFGKPWTLIVNSPSGAVSAWSADLDNNGTNDLVLFMPAIGGDSWAPNARVLLLMFEKNGRPVPLCTTGFFSVDKYGLKELVDINDDGKPELISQDRTAHYWVTSIFENRNCRWSARKEIAGQALPFHTQFTAKANHSIVRRVKFKNSTCASMDRAMMAQSKDISNMILLSVDWCRAEPGESVVVAKQNNCSAINSPLGDGTVVMLDDMSGRRISIGTTSISRRLLEEMSFRKLPVALRIEDACSTRTTTLVYARAFQAF